MGHVGDEEGGTSSAAGASDKSLPSTSAAPGPAPAPPAAPGGPAVTTVDRGSDDVDSGPKTFSNMTGQLKARVAQQAEITGPHESPGYQKLK